MQAFTLTAPDTLAAALSAGVAPRTRYIAGGTDLLQLAQDDVEQPTQLVDLVRLLPSAITVERDPMRIGALRIGALATMADVADAPLVRQGWPAISEALLLSASPQIRNMGTAGGNLLQRTRCGYFRDTGFGCNKRVPGSGCPAIGGDNRGLGVVGVSGSCIATHPSDLPVALMAMDAVLELLGPTGGRRTVPLAEFYRLPGTTPHLENNLLPGEAIVAIIVPADAAALRSRYVKVRDRTEFAFAVVSAAVALDVQNGVVRDVRVALGGVGPKPWRLPLVEAALHGRPATLANFEAAAALASAGTTPASRNAHKVTLMQRLTLRGLQLAAA